MEYLQVLPVSLLSIVVLFILTKLMGYKQVSQLSMFDYIIGGSEVGNVPPKHIRKGDRIVRQRQAVRGKLQKSKT